MSIANPTFNDLVRVTACPPGAEITGAVMIDSKTMLINSQHPDAGNTFPYNNSLTYAISGWDGTPAVSIIENKSNSKAFNVFPNPVTRELNLNKMADIAIYNMNGQRIKVLRDVEKVDVSDLAAGAYIIMNTEGNKLKFIVE
jgi:secreted PhoX family phosphatase